jgi:hypothetical protein
MAADLERLTQIARTHYNVANPTATITQDTAYRAVILGLLAILTAQVPNVGTVTDRV